MEKLGGGFPGFLYETQTGGGSEREKKAFEQDIEEHWREGTHTENTIRHYLDWGMNLAGRRVTTCSHNTMRYQGRTWFCPLRLWVFVCFIATKRFVLWGTLWRGEGRGGEGKKGGREGRKEGGREGRRKGKREGYMACFVPRLPQPKILAVECNDGSAFIVKLE